MSQILLFLIAILYGIILRSLYFAQTKLAKYGKSRVLKIMLDSLWCILSFGGFFLMSFFLAEGSFYFFMLMGSLSGFFGVLLIPFHRMKKKKKL